MKVLTKVWINDDQGKIIFGGGRVRMLEAIELHGSMNKAAKELKMSYRALWGRVKSTEDRLGTKLVDARPGGGKGRGSVLTPTAKRLLEEYKLLEARIVKIADREFNKIFGGRRLNEE